MVDHWYATAGHRGGLKFLDGPQETLVLLLQPQHPTVGPLAHLLAQGLLTFTQRNDGY